MSGHKLEIDRAAGAGNIYVETSDIESIDPARDGRHAAAMTVRWRIQYQEAGAFEFLQGGKLLRMQLLPRQVRAAVEQLREKQAGFCNGERERGCYDYGKVERPPASCARCLLIEACRRSRQGDLRRVSPVTTYGPGSGLLMAFCVLLVIWVWTLNRWSAAAEEAGQARSDLVGCRTKYSPTVKR
jgi:hypothetical protein